MISPSRGKHVYRTNILNLANPLWHQTFKTSYSAETIGHRTALTLQFCFQTRTHASSDYEKTFANTTTRNSSFQEANQLNVAAWQTVNSTQFNHTKIQIDELPPFATNLTSVLSLSLSRWVGPQVYIVYNGWLWLESDHFNFKKLSADISVHPWDI